jgi:O-antigen/teichoic acid export membrane protein
MFFLQFTVLSATAVLNFGMFYCLTGLVVVTIIRYIWLLIILKKYARPVFSTAFIREHLSFGFPLIVSALLGSSAQYIDGFLVMNKYDAATFAIFQYGAREFPLVLLMANAFSTAMIPEFSGGDNLESPLNELKVKSGKMMHLLFPVTIILLLFSSWIYPRIFNDNFTESAGIFNIYLLLIMSRLVFPQTILTGLNKTRVILMASIAELAVNISLSILFINLWGIAGVAFGTLIAYTVQKLIWLLYIKKVLKINPGKYIPVKLLAFYSVVLIIAFSIVF